MGILDWIPGYDSGDDNREPTPVSGGSVAGAPDDTGGDGGGSSNPLAAYTGVLTQLGRSPVGFVTGAILSSILGGIEAIVTAFLDAISLIFVGSDPTSTEGTLGLADLPLFTAELLVDGTRPVGSAIISTADTLTASVLEIASNAGPFAPIVVAAIVAALFVGTAWTLRTAIDVVADAVPGLQGLIKP